MRFLLVTLGPACDVYPFLALGAALQKAGHSVTLLAEPCHQTASTQARLPFAAISQLGKELNWVAINTRMRAAPSRFEKFAQLYAGLAPIVDGLLQETLAKLPEYEVLVTSHPLSFLKLAAQKIGRKSAVLVFNPNDAPYADIPPKGSSPPPRWAPKFWHQFQMRNEWAAEQKQLDRIVNQTLGATLHSRGLGRFQGFLCDPADRALVTISPALFPPPGTLPGNYAYTGFLRWLTAPDGHAAAELAGVRALEQTGMALPVVTMGNADAAEARKVFARLLAAWPRGAPLAVQADENGLAADPQRPEVLVVGPMPHEELFTHATVVIHHGAADTTSAALHAGRPQIIIPRHEDEMWWAQATEKLGITKIMPSDTWPEMLRETLEVMLRDVNMLRRVADCATRARAEDGAAATVRALEKITISPSVQSPQDNGLNR